MKYPSELPQYKKKRDIVVSRRRYRFPERRSTEMAVCGEQLKGTCPTCNSVKPCLLLDIPPFMGWQKHQRFRRVGRRRNAVCERPQGRYIQDSLRNLSCKWPESVNFLFLHCNFDVNLFTANSTRFLGRRTRTHQEHDQREPLEESGRGGFEKNLKGSIRIRKLFTASLFVFDMRIFEMLFETPPRN